VSGASVSALENPVEMVLFSCLEVRDTSSKDELILDSLFGVKIYRFKMSLLDIS